jgi:transposase
MWIDYGVRIAETADELRARERAVRGQRTADRVKLLRLLKSGAARSVRQAAAMLGYSERQAQRWWASYARGGLPAVLEVGRPGGSRERITPEAWADLSAHMRAGAIGRLKDAQAYLQKYWGISYCLDGISKLFIRRKAKLKTGRPRHREADAAAQAAFKKGVRHHA